MDIITNLGILAAASLVGMIVSLNAWHSRHMRSLSAITPKERREIEEEDRHDIQVW
jgi:hypothetical protein